MRDLLFHPGHLGDMVLLAQATVGMALPESGLDLLVRRQSVPLAAGWSRGEVHILPDGLAAPRVPLRSWLGWALMRGPVGGGVDALVTLRPGRRWQAVSRLVQASNRVAVEPDPARDRRTGTFPMESQHEVVRLRDALRGIEQRQASVRPVQEQDWPQVFPSRPRASSASSGPVVLHVGSNHLKKELGLEFLYRLCRRLLMEFRCDLVLTGASQREVAIAGELRSRLGAAVDDKTGQLTLTQLQHVFDQASAFLGYDSGPTHLAAARGTPVLAIFCGTNMFQWRPFGPIGSARVFAVDRERVNADEAVLDAVVAFTVESLSEVLDANQQSNSGRSIAEVLEPPVLLTPSVR